MLKFLRSSGRCWVAAGIFWAAAAGCCYYQPSSETFRQRWPVLVFLLSAEGFLCALLGTCNEAEAHRGGTRLSQQQQPSGSEGAAQPSPALSSTLSLDAAQHGKLDNAFKM